MVVLSLVFVFSLFSPTAITQAASVDRPLIIIASDSPGPADPAENWSFGGASYLPQAYETLFRFAGENSPVLEHSLAMDIPSTANGGISADGLVYTIKLKPGIKFHDGSPLNADAVIYSYERTKAMQKGVNGITADWITKMEKLDDATVQFTLKEPFADFLNSMGSVWGNYIVNPKLVKEHETNGDWGYEWLKQNEAGSGPYVISKIDTAGNQIFLDRSKEYWGGWKNPNPVEKVIIRWLAEPTGARPLIEKGGENGGADIAVNLPATDFDALEKTDGITSMKYPSIMQYYIAMNSSVDPLKDAKVRQALQYSFNDPKVIEDIFLGNLMPMKAAVGPGYPEVQTPKTVYTYDLEKAKALLKEAGLEEGFEIQVNLVGAFPNDQTVMEFWQADLAKIGVKLNIKQIDYPIFDKAWFQECSAGTAPNVGELSALGVGGDYPSAWVMLGQVYPTPRLGGGKCAVDYIDNPKITEAWKKLANTIDPAERKAIFADLYELIAQDAGTIWVGQGVDLVTVRESVSGYKYYFARGGNYVPLADISLTK